MRKIIMKGKEIVEGYGFLFDASVLLPYPKPKNADCRACRMVAVGIRTFCPEHDVANRPMRVKEDEEQI